MIQLLCLDLSTSLRSPYLHLLFKTFISLFYANILYCSSVMPFTNIVAVATYTLEAFLYGVYLILFGYTMGLVWKRRKYSTRITVAVIGSALCLLFILATVHMIMSQCLLFLYVLPDLNVTSNFLYYRDGVGSLDVVSKSVWVSTMVTANSLVAWRCWVLWGRRSWIVITFMALQSSLVAHTLMSLHSSLKIRLTSNVAAWYIGLNVVSLSTNMLGSGLISFRIYQAGRQVTRTDCHVRAKKYRSLLWIYLESCSIYPTVLIIALALYFLNSSLGWLVIVNSVQICGMMPTFMIIAVLSTGKSLSESAMMDSYTTSSLHAMRTKSRRSNANELVAPARPPQLTVPESGSELPNHVVQAETKFTRSASSYGLF